MSIFSKLKIARALILALIMFFATVGSLVVLNPAYGYGSSSFSLEMCKGECGATCVTDPHDYMVCMLNCEARCEAPYKYERCTNSCVNNSVNRDWPESRFQECLTACSDRYKSNF